MSTDAQVRDPANLVCAWGYGAPELLAADDGYGGVRSWTALVLGAVGDPKTILYRFVY